MGKACNKVRKALVSNLNARAQEVAQFVEEMSRYLLWKCCFSTRWFSRAELHTIIRLIKKTKHKTYPNGALPRRAWRNSTGASYCFRWILLRFWGFKRKIMIIGTAIAITGTVMGRHWMRTNLRRLLDEDWWSSSFNRWLSTGPFARKNSVEFPR